MLGLIVYASNGRSGLGALMITSVAGVAILSATLPALAVAAAASMMLLGETMLRFLQRGDMGTTAIGNELMIAAFISATLFFTALVISRLARRLAMQERLAIRQRRRSPQPARHPCAGGGRAGSGRGRLRSATRDRKSVV